MKKTALLSMALISALVVGSTPLASYAVETESERYVTDGCYRVYILKQAKSLSQVLKEFGLILGPNGNLCLGGNKPDVDIPVTQEPEITKPETQEPTTGEPEPTKPETQEPTTGESEPTKPEAQEPTTGESEPTKPETQEPTTGESEPTKPETQEPTTGEPDIDVSEEVTLSYAEQVVKLVNEERAKAGLSALEIKQDITAAANVRAKEIKQLFSHTRPNGSSFSSALKEQGVSYRGSGENIAWGQKSPEQVMNGWMNSSGHRANILNKNFKNIGVGYYQDAKGVNYWVQLFTY